MTSPSRFSVFIGAAAVMFVAVACGVDAAGPAETARISLDASGVPDTMYRLIGNGDYYEAGGDPDLLITAVRHFDGSFTGNVSDPANMRHGPVTGITPPSETYPFWCIELALDAFPGFTVLTYVEDLDNGIDRIAFGGDYGATCALYPSPLAVFEELLGGDFRGSVKTK
jgi:hypothetical protein